MTRARPRGRDVRYAATAAHLTRTVTFPPGDPRRAYAHRCPLAAFDAVAAAVADLPPGSAGTTAGELAARLGLPFTQADVALEFLTERGVAEVRHGRRTHPASRWAYEDALAEYHALRGPG